MNNRIKLLTVATLAVAFAIPGFAAKDPGQVDFGTMPSAAGRQFVEVNLQPNLISLAAKIVSKQEPQVAELLRNIKHVRVNVVGLDDTNRGTVDQKMQAVRADLESRGWSPVVTVRDEGGENVNVHIKTGENDVIQGLVVTVIGNDNEAVFVNIVGEINPDQIAEIANRFDIEPLKKIRIEQGE
ncbi:MAG TPA: DUF4252 domain-containing protein [Opitutaceae bacterium]|nr:DUF4252 domain-containing protein [Opitutaceae bacterium]